MPTHSSRANDLGSKPGSSEDDAPPGLQDGELEQIESRSSPRPLVVYEVIRLEGEQELLRTSPALAWSGLAAGLSMGFSLVAQGSLRSRLPDVSWRPLIVSAGYSVGFLIVILGRQQLFTENTLTPILPLLHRPSVAKFFQVMRLWAIVLATNLLGAFLFAWVLARTGLFDARAHGAFTDIARDAVAGSFANTCLHGLFAGWLIALMVWMLPGAETARLTIIVIITYLVGIAGFSHIIAGSVEAFYLLTTGQAGLAQIGSWAAATLLGNMTGGLALVAALGHAQVTSGSDIEKKKPEGRSSGTSKRTSHPRTSGR